MTGRGSDGRSVVVEQSGTKYAYVIVDPVNGRWRSEFTYRSEALAYANGKADLEWIRAGEATDPPPIGDCDQCGALDVPVTPAPEPHGESPIKLCADCVAWNAQDTGP
jgi:hypothetical protein